MKYKYILWDWNGTLFEDVDICVKVMNKLLSKRGMPKINREYYRTIFCFPVIEYYIKLNFDFKRESFEKISVEFIEEYNKESYNAGLIKGVIDILERFNLHGIRQGILSAAYVNNLLEQVKRIGVEHLFNDFLGLQNIHAAGKIELAKEWFSKTNLNPNEIMLIGDTVHDYETARELNCDVVLVSYGHQSKETLKYCNTIILDTVQDLKDYLLNNYMLR